MLTNSGKEETMQSTEELISAVQAGDSAKVRDLLSRDSSLASARDSSGVSALMHAIYRRNQEIAGLILSSHPGLDVFEATATGNTKRVAELLDADPSLAGAYSADGFTALHLSAFFAQPQAAELLLQHGADTSAVATNATQVMPLHSAAAGRSFEVVQLLLQHGAPVNAKQQHGWTALHSAVNSGDEKMVDLLMQHGADPNATNSGGVTSIQLARDKGHNKILNILQAGSAIRARIS
jgi:uncharacterized protein